MLEIEKLGVNVPTTSIYSENAMVLTAYLRVSLAFLLFASVQIPVGPYGPHWTDTDNIHANLLNRSLADNNGLLPSFDGGQVDYARDEIDLEKYSLDAVFGKRLRVSDSVTASWKVGVRAAYSDLDRNVFYQNNETPYLGGPFVLTMLSDTANIDFSSRMYGAGPTLGGGLKIKTR